jgi:hypothetical protein
MICEIALNHPTNSNSLEGRRYAMTRNYGSCRAL